MSLWWDNTIKEVQSRRHVRDARPDGCHLEYRTGVVREDVCVCLVPVCWIEDEKNK